MAEEFEGPRTAIVTGGAKRIGAALARALSADGWHVLIHCNRSRERAEALAAELGDSSVVAADLAEPEAADAVTAALDGLPPARLLVNNASRWIHDRFDDFDAAGWDAHHAINVRAPALLSRAFAARLGGRSGLIVNLLDAKLAQPNPDYFSYTASKLAFAGLAELMARELAGRGVRVCGIAPSVTMVEGPHARADFDRAYGRNALRRGVEAEQIVRALRFLIDTPTITGETIVLDAGLRFLGLGDDEHLRSLS